MFFSSLLLLFPQSSNLERTGSLRITQFTPEVGSAPKVIC